MLYQILVGRPPYEGATPLEAVLKVLNEKPIRWLYVVGGGIGGLILLLIVIRILRSIKSACCRIYKCIFTNIIN